MLVPFAALVVFMSAAPADRLPELLAARNSPNQAVRAKADKEWEAIGPGVRASLPYVRRSLAAGTDPQGIQKAADGFAKSGLDVVPGLLDAVADERPGQPQGYIPPPTRPVSPRGMPMPPASSRFAEAAVQTFVTLGPPVVPALAAALSDNSPAVREVAATALGRMAAVTKATAPPRIDRHADLADALKPTLPALIARFDDPDPAVRQRAAEAVGQLGAAVPGAVPALAAALVHRDPAVRRAAVVALKSADPTTEPLRTSLTAALDDPEPAVRVSAAELLGKLDPPPAAALDTLVAELRTRDTTTRSAAVQALEALAAKAKPVVPALKALTRDRDPLTRVYASRALVKIDGDEAEIGVMALRQLLADDSARVRVTAAEGLWQAGQFDEAVPAVVAALGTPDGGSIANMLLSRVQPTSTEAKAVVLALGDALTDAAPNARQQLLNTLLRFGPVARPVVPAVAKMLRSGDDGTRQTAVSVLQQIGVTKAAVPDLVEGLRSANDYTRRQVGELLRGLGTDAKEAVPVLVKMATDGPPSARIEAVRVLLRVSPDDLSEVGPALAALFKSPEGMVRSQAIQLLYEFGTSPPKAMIPALLEATRSTDPSLRQQAGSALARMGGAAGPEVRAALKAMLADKDPDLRLQAATLLNQAGAGEQEAIIAALTELIDSPNATVRLRAAEQLRTLGAEAATTSLRVIRKALTDADPDRRLWGARLVLQPAARPGRAERIPTGVTADDITSAVAIVNRALVDGPPNRRGLALTALWSADKEHVAAALEGLTAAAADPDANTRMTVARTLARVVPEGRELAVRVYADLATGGDPFSGHYFQAVTGLQELGSEAALAEVMAMRLRGDARVRGQALQTISSMDRSAARPLAPALREVLTEPTLSVRLQAAEVLARVGGPADVAAAADALFAMAQDGNESINPQAMTALRKLGKPWSDRVKPLLRAQLAAESAAAKLSAARDLIRDRSEDRKLIAAAVREVMKQGQSRERVQAAEILLEADPTAATEAVAVMRQLIGDRQARDYALPALVKVGPEHDRVLLAATREMLQDPDRSARYQALPLVHRFASQLTDLIPKLAELTDDPGFFGPTARALAAMGEPGVKHLLVALDRGGTAASSAVWGLQTADWIDKSAMSKFIALSRSTDRNTQYQGESLLQHFRAEAVPALVKELAGPTADGRRHAAEQLGKMWPVPRAAVPALEALAGDPDAAVRLAGARTAYRAGSRDKGVVRALAEAIRETDPAARAEVIGQIDGSGLLPGPVLATLKPMLSDPNGRVRVAAAAVLVSHPDAADDAAKVLIAAVRDPATRLPAISAVASAGPKPERLKELIPELKAFVATTPPGSEWWAVGRAVVTLQAFGCPDLRPFLVEVIRSGRAPTSSSAYIAALCATGPEGVAAARELFPRLHHTARTNALPEFGRAARTDPTIVPFLVEQLSAGRPSGHTDELRAFMLAGPAAKSAGPALAALLSEPPYTQLYAALAIAHVGCPDGRTDAYRLIRGALDRVAGSTTTPSAVELVEGIGHFGPDAVDAVPALVKLLGTRNAFTQMRVAEALGRIGPPAATAADGLRRALAADDPRVRAHAAVALWRITGDAAAAVPRLTEVLDDDTDWPRTANDGRVRWLFVPQGQSVGGDESAPRLVALRTLGEIGHPAATAVPSVTRAAEDFDPAVRAAAVDALKRIRSVEPEGRP